MRKLVLCILIALSPCAHLFAQGAVAGKITGVITDPSGAVIPGAVVTVTSPALLNPRSQKSVGGGVYLVEELPPGVYTVECTEPGFKSYLAKGITLTAGFTATVNMVLALGDEAQTVTVSDSGPLVDVESSVTPITFDALLLANSPSGNDPWSMLAQTPGVTVSTVDVGGNNSYQQSSMSVHGSKTTETVYAFNGLDLNYVSQTSTGYYVDQYASDEVQVETGASPPEIPVGGTYLNMITRQGSNVVHGFVLYSYEDDKTQRTLQAPYYTPIASVAALGAVAGPVLTDGSPFIRAYDSAVDIGGPIIRDKWWIFGAYREYQLKQQLRASPLPNPVTGGPAATPGLYGFGTDTNHQSNTTLRNDYQINSKNVVNAIWHWQYINRFFRRSGGTYVDQDAALVQIEPAYIVQAQEIWTPTSHLTIDSRIGYLNLLFPERYEPTVAAQTISASDIGESTVEYAGPMNFAESAKSGRAASTASYFHGGWRGSHTFKVGVDVSLNHDYNKYNYNQNIIEEYDTLNAASLPNTTPYEVLVKNGPVAYHDWSRGVSFFVQDAWTFNRHFTLNIGGRYDQNHAWIPSQCNPAVSTTAYAPLFPYRCTAQVQAAYATLSSEGKALGPLTPYSDVATYSQFVPRISLAFDPSGKGKSVIRGGFNIFTNNIGTSLAGSLNPNSVATATFGWNGSTIANSATAGAINSATPDYKQFANNCGTYAPGTAGCLAGGTVPFGTHTNGSGGWISTTGGFTSFADPNLKRPYSIMYNVEYERSLFGNIMVSAAYYYRNNRNLQTTANINAPTSDYTPTTVYLSGSLKGQPIINPLTGAAMTLYSLTGNSKACYLPPLYASLTATDVGCTYTETTNNPQANTNHYNGLEFTMVRRMTGKWSAQIGFTIQGDKGTSTSGDFNDPNLNINRFGSIDQDVPYVFRADVTYKLPLKMQTSVNFQHETGSPILPTYAFNAGLNQGSETVNLEPNGSIRYPSVNDTNLRIGRTTAFGDRFKLETDCDLNNLFNGSATTAQTNTFGTAFLKPSTFVGPFIARFQARVTF